MTGGCPVRTPSTRERRVPAEGSGIDGFRDLWFWLVPDLLDEPFDELHSEKADREDECHRCEPR